MGILIPRVSSPPVTDDLDAASEEKKAPHHWKGMLCLDLLGSHRVQFWIVFWHQATFYLNISWGFFVRPFFLSAVWTWRNTKQHQDHLLWIFFFRLLFCFFQRFGTKEHGHFSFRGTWPWSLGWAWASACWASPWSGGTSAGPPAGAGRRWQRHRRRRRWPKARKKNVQVGVS